MKVLHRALLTASFNQDCSCLAVGTKTGFRIFNCDPFGKSLVRNDGGIGIVEMLFTTNIIALVGAGEQHTHSPRRLQIMNTKKQSVICELDFPSAVLAVHLNRRRLVVVLDSAIHVYDLSNMKRVASIDINYNPHAVTALSSSSDRCYLAYPTYVHPHAAAPPAKVSDPPLLSADVIGASPTSSSNSGSKPSASATSSSSTQAGSGGVTLFDVIEQHPVVIIPAHKAPLAAMTFSASGRYLATASTKGTIIRVFSVPDGAQLFQFRRGTYPARIFSLQFHPNEQLLAASSETETVHIFKLGGGGGTEGGGGAVASTGTDSASFTSVSSAGYPPATAGSASASSPTTATTAGGDPPPSTATAAAPFFNALVGTAAGAVTSLWSKRATIQAYLPDAFVNAVLDPARDFARAKVPTGIGERSVVGFSPVAPHVYVVTSEGYLHVYALDLERGEECVLVKQERVVDEPA
ncbi:autophagy protein [Allomyces javanicus]|nr:autophagy protein [Allomyces javanicus]